MDASDPHRFDLHILDLGNVVIRDIETLDAIADRYGFEIDTLHVDYPQYIQPLMEGSFDPPLYWSHVERQFGIRVHEDPFVEFFDPRWNEPLVSLVNALRENKNRVIVGSNT